MHSISTSRMSIFLLSVIMLFYYHWFYLIKYPAVISFLLQGHRFYVTFGVFALISAFYYLFKKKRLFSIRHKSIVVQCTFFLGAWVTEVIYSWVAYDQSLDEAISNGARLLMVFFFITYLVVFISCGGVRKAFQIINIFALVWAIVAIFQSVVYKENGTILFDITSYFQNSSGLDIKTYNGNLRISLFSFGNISIIYNFIQIHFSNLKKKSTIKALFMFVVELYAAITVQQTRMYSITLLLCCLTVVFLKKNLIKSFFFKVALFVGGSVFLIYSSIITVFFESFSVVGDNRWSTLARLSAIDYYLNCIIERPIFGNGFLAEGLFSTIIHGNDGDAFYNDLGLLGLIAETGVMALVFYVIPVVMIVHKLILLKRHNLLNDLDIALFTFILGTSLTLILTSESNCIAFGFLMAYFEYRCYFEPELIYRNNINKGKKKLYKEYIHKKCI